MSEQPAMFDERRFWTSLIGIIVACLAMGFVLGWVLT